MRNATSTAGRGHSTRCRARCKHARSGHEAPVGSGVGPLRLAEHRYWFRHCFPETAWQGTAARLCRSPVGLSNGPKSPCIRLLYRPSTAKSRPRCAPSSDGLALSTQTLSTSSPSLDTCAVLALVTFHPHVSARSNLPQYLLRYHRCTPPSSLRWQHTSVRPTRRTTGHCALQPCTRAARRHQNLCKIRSIERAGFTPSGCPRRLYSRARAALARHPSTEREWI